MAVETSGAVVVGRRVHAGGIDIHYVEAGLGEPLVLLHGGIVSTNEIWTGNPFAYVSHLQTFAEHFRVIAPDTRGCGRTAHPGDPVSYTRLADDAVALVDALDLERPLLCGFSEGGQTAAIVGIRSPETARAIVNHAGYDLFNPEAPSCVMMRKVLGGSPQATHADPVAVEQFFNSSEEMRATFSLMQADHDGAQGHGHWKTMISELFDRVTQPLGFTFEDLARVTAPTLILTGDRDQFCSAEEGALAYRSLQHGELAILPNHGHVITPAAIAATVEFLLRHAHL